MSKTTSLSGGYDPAAIEDKWYQFWMEREDFQPEPQSDAPSFCIVIPPPNVTGVLHTGHALDNTLQDVLIRYHRMLGHNTLWIPGTDHAGIATQSVVERELRKEGKSRHDLGREAFLERVWQFKEKSGNRIIEQLKKLGASCDWSRQRFTMDPGLSKAVREVFVRLYEEGLIYRAERLINWDPAGQTALSDLEVEKEEGFTTELWSFAYPLAEGEGEIVVATTRPETMLGDTAVAVHPEDPRYKHLLGKFVRHPIVDRLIPIVGDGILVDPQFGTGAVKVTPAHDFNDFECGKRNGLQFLNIFNLDGTLNTEGGPFAGQDRFEARKAVKARIAELGLERGSKPHVMALPRSERSKAVVEPMLSTQWFVKMKSLAEPAIEAVRSGEVEVLPEAWQATYFHWMENIQDWCISRQLWWGHRIPAWYCGQGHITVSREDVKSCETCGATELRQDPDVLDTWFSSWLWPFSTMGWPEQTKDLQTFYPTSVLVTGFDILFFWVARMMMAGLKFMGQSPFKRVFLHALVRDAQGRKISKSLGNALDPVELMDKYGTDALRFTLAILTVQGRDILLDENRIEGYKHFVNKLFNATRFVLMNLPEEGAPPTPSPKTGDLRLEDRWILSRLQHCIAEVTAGLEDGHFNQACSAQYSFVWHELCDWYLEVIKPRLSGDDPEERAVVQGMLLGIFDTTLRLLHPVMPFVTEELASHLPVSERPLVRASWPKVDSRFTDPGAEKQMEALMETIRTIRNVRGELNLPPGAWLTVLYSGEPEAVALFQEHDRAIRALCRAKELRPLTEEKPKLSAQAAGPGFEVCIPLEGLLDLDKELKRLQTSVKKAQAEVQVHEKKLQNPKFVESAPAEIVEASREKLRLAQEELQAASRALTRMEELARS